MKSNHLPVILILVLIIISVVLATTAFQKTDALSPNLAAASFKAQVSTPTPVTQEDKTRAGTTDGIVIMGFVIVVIVLFPVLFRKK